MKTHILTWLIAAWLLPFLGQSAVAEMLTIPFEYEFSGAVAPEGNRPWVTATFDDESTIGSVKLEFDLSNLVDDEFIGRALFNLDPALDPTSLTFGSPTKNGSFADPVIRTEIDTFRTAGQWFDLEFDFAESNSDNTEDRFGAGESMVIEIAAPGLEAGSFDFSSNSDYGPGPLTGAIRVKGIGELGEFSGWISDHELFPVPEVPEPSATAYLLSLTALALLATAWRRRRRIRALASAQ